jgi:hypothetical protein
LIMKRDTSYAADEKTGNSLQELKIGQLVGQKSKRETKNGETYRKVAARATNMVSAHIRIKQTSL